MDRFGKDRSHDSAMGYDLAPTARSLELPGEAVIRSSPALALDALAADLLAQAVTCVRHFGDFHLAIGGDASIEALYLRLMSDTDLRAIPWKKTHLWMTHERRVEEDDDRRLATALREFIIDHSDIPREQAHLIPIDESDAPQQYERAIREALASADTTGLTASFSLWSRAARRADGRSSARIRRKASFCATGLRPTGRPQRSP